ncbi:MAG: hypothetical protein HUU46_01000 [Candidatus Hydrogenedentes bacterium]|nr:hypothetical protein [Candidatus Hydrogenedentota bacterium]
MTARVADMTVDELKQLISESVHESFEDLMEDLAAMNSPSYIASVEEARSQYKRGEIVTLDELERG